MALFALTVLRLPIINDEFLIYHSCEAEWDAVHSLCGVPLRGGPSTNRILDLLKRVGDELIFKVHLCPGKHLDKFFVHGKWIPDPGNKLWEQHEHNTGNSVVWIGKNPVM